MLIILMKFFKNRLYDQISYQKKIIRIYFKMTKVYSQCDDIRAFLDDMINNETAKRTQLKKQIDELSKQGSSKTVSSEKQTEQNLIKDDDVILHFGTKTFKKILKSNAGVNDLFSMSNLNLGTNEVGFKDSNDQDSITYVRTNQDLKYVFTIYFTKNIPFLHIVALKNEDVASFKKFNLRKESINKNDDCAVFRVQVLGPDSSLIFLAIPTKYSKTEGMTYLQSIFGNISEMTFVDEDGDIIIIDSSESWDYSINASFTMNKKGKYPRLTINRS